MKRYFQKQKSKIRNYRYTKSFLQSEYRQQILYELSLSGNVWGAVFFKSFLGMCEEALDKNDPVKQKYFKGTIVRS